MSAAPRVLEVEGVHHETAENRAVALDELERRAVLEGLLVTQDPANLGVYHAAPGRAFRAAPGPIQPAEVEKRRRAHDAAIYGRAPLLKKPSASLTPARELSAPSGLLEAWPIEALDAAGVAVAKIHGCGRSFFAARLDAATAFSRLLNKPIEPGDLRLVTGVQ